MEQELAAESESKEVKESTQQWAKASEKESESTAEKMIK